MKLLLKSQSWKVERLCGLIEKGWEQALTVVLAELLDEVENVAR
jgi:hypothetical protein